MDVWVFFPSPIPRPLVERRSPTNACPGSVVSGMALAVVSGSFTAFQSFLTTTEPPALLLLLLLPPPLLLLPPAAFAANERCSACSSCGSASGARWLKVCNISGYRAV